MVPAADGLSPEFVQHLQDARNSGCLEAPDAEAKAVNPACGDELRLTLQVRAGIISAARFEAFGCAAAVAAGSAVTELLQGLPVADVAAAITAEAVEAALGGLPRHRRHAALLASQAATLAARSAREGNSN
jgi:NifU-like protein involved in Fe-S cluster formation